MIEGTGNGVTEPGLQALFFSKMKASIMEAFAFYNIKTDGHVLCIKKVFSFGLVCWCPCEKFR